MDKRFKAVAKRCEAMSKRLALLQWTMGLGFSPMIAFTAFLKIWS